MNPFSSKYKPLYSIKLAVFLLDMDHLFQLDESDYNPAKFTMNKRPIISNYISFAQDEQIYHSLAN